MSFNEQKNVLQKTRKLCTRAVEMSQNCGWLLEYSVMSHSVCNAIVCVCVFNASAWTASHRWRACPSKNVTFYRKLRQIGLNLQNWTGAWEDCVFAQIFTLTIQEVYIVSLNTIVENTHNQLEIPKHKRFIIQLTPKLNKKIYCVNFWQTKLQKLNIFF